MSAIEKSLPDRMTKLETTTEAMVRLFEEMKRDMNARFERMESHFERMDSRFEQINARFDSRFEQINARFDSRFDTMHTLMASWLKWILGFSFTSWLTLMASIWLKR